MRYDYFVRITHSYESSARLLSAWALKCEKMVCYEHVGEETEKIHIHVLILGCSITKKQLRNIGQEFVPLKGNEYCSFKECVAYETPLVYMTKGVLHPKYLIGFTKEECEAARLKWVEPVGKQCKDKVIYDECFYVNSQWWEPDMSLHGLVLAGDIKHPADCDCKFKKVKKRAQWFVLGKCGVWNMRAMAMYKMLVYTFCFNQGVPIPKDSQFGKWL